MDRGTGGVKMVWSSGTGAYGGLTFNGSAVKARDEWNADFYGSGATVSGILGSHYNNRATGRTAAQSGDRAAISNNDTA